MALEPLCDASDVEARLRRDLTDSELEALPAVQQEVDVEVRSYCTAGIPTPVPDEVVVVASRVAARALAAPAQDVNAAGVASTQMMAGVFQMGRTFTADRANASGGVYLTRADKRLLRRWAKGGRVMSVRTW